MCISDTIKELADKKGLTVSALEKAVGLGNGTIGKWKKQSPSCDKLMLVAEYLSVSVDYLITGKENITGERLSEDECDLLKYYRKLPEEEKIRLVSRAEAVAEVYERLKK